MSITNRYEILITKLTILEILAADKFYGEDNEQGEKVIEELDRILETTPC